MTEGTPSSPDSPASREATASGEAEERVVELVPQAPPGTPKKEEPGAVVTDPELLRAEIQAAVTDGLPAWAMRRLPVLGILLVALATLVQRHVSFEWFTVGLGSVATPALVLLGREAFLSIRRDEKALRAVRAWVLFGVQKSVLASLSAAVVILAAFFSSITIMASGAKIPAGRPLTVTLVPSNGWAEQRVEKLATSEAVIRLNYLTTPFGRPVGIQVDGYERSNFKLYPGTGKQILLTEDLTPIPSLLVRLPARKAGTNEQGGGVIVLFQRSDSGFTEVARVSTQNLYSSYLFGRQLPIKNELTAAWKDELAILGPAEFDNFGGVDDSRAKDCLLRWKRTVAAPAAAPPGTSLCAVYYSQAPCPEECEESEACSACGREEGDPPRDEIDLASVGGHLDFHVGPGELQDCLLLGVSRLGHESPWPAEPEVDDIPIDGDGSE